MGGMFAFMGSQYRLEVAGKEFLIDLLLFHRHLRCLVAIELKAQTRQSTWLTRYAPKKPVLAHSAYWTTLFAQRLIYLKRKSPQAT